MAHKKNNKPKRTEIYYLLFFLSILTIVFFASLFFQLWPANVVPSVSKVYISSENAKPGDTVLIKVNGRFNSISGSFNNENIDFFKNKTNSNWIAFLGIDVATLPGKYTISINASSEKIEKEINIAPEIFSSVGMTITKNLANKGFTAAKVNENVIKKDNPILSQVIDKFTPTPYFKDSFGFPLSSIQKSGLGFGEFIKGKNYQLQHLGIDLKAELGTKVYAINDGKVVLAKDMTNYGKTIVIDHGLGIFSLYLHLEQYIASEGQHVKKGQVIGLSGDSGFSTAPHLHFSIKDNGTRVDPISFIKTTQETEESSNMASVRDSFLKIFGIQ